MAYRNLGSGATYVRNENEIFHAASTMKVPVMMALFQAIDSRRAASDRADPRAQPVPEPRGRLALSRSIPRRTVIRSSTRPSAQTRPLEELIRRMIVRSSNLATNLSDREDRRLRASDLMRSLGAYQHPGAARRGG